MKELKEKVAVVTGAASGIGRALAERFAAEGMRVVLTDVEEGALTKAEGELKAMGATTLAVRADVSKGPEVDLLAKRTLEAFGAVHVVCNNAGVGGDFCPTWEQTVENWKWVLDVNLWGVIHGIRTFVPIMLEQGTEGHVVNTSSMAGLMSTPFGAVYHATKHAVVTISESLHYELEMIGARVKASVLCPGFVHTNIMDSERNRPQELRTESRRVTEGEKNWLEAYRGFVTEGLPPAKVADLVLQGIREERFYLFPHPETLDMVRARTDNVLAQRNPEIALADEMRERLKI